ncbi:AMP-binding protein [Streptomyces sp. SAS_270]|uniref:AMP-binding protein n=1 Tax=Streptomyces sp. SAS_270 TaxID=3412748 RepID=UPI00403D0F32
MTQTQEVAIGLGEQHPVADLGGLLVRAAAAFPRHGVRYCSRQRPLDSGLCTYPQLLEDALGLLGALRKAGAGPGRAVALLLERPEDFLPAFWACLLGQITVCPLVPVRDDPQRWAAQLNHVNTLLDGPLVVTDRQVAEELPALPDLAITTIEDLAAAGAQPGTVAVTAAGADDVALLVLTSGSTGAAKAVRLTHGNLLASMAAKARTQALTAHDVTLNWISYDHVAALLEAHLLPLSVGAVQLHASPEAVLADPVHFLELIDAHRVSMTFTPNFLLGLINKALDELPSPPDLDLSCLRHIVSGGEANPLATGTGFLDRLAPHGLHPGALWPAFGMTETCAGSIYNREFPDADLGAEFAAVGRPVDGLRIRIVAEDTTTPLADGEAGEVQLTGPMITSGYANNKEATQAAFTADGWFRTGDLGRLTRGRLTLVGRSKDSIIVNGVNYYSHDLESLLNTLDGIAKSYVAAFPTRPPGSDTEQLAIAFAPAPEAAGDEAALHRLIVAVRNSVVLHWGFRPALLLPLTPDAFPKTSLGKIQRSLMRRRLENGDYAGHLTALQELINRQLGGYDAPEGAAENTLAQLYGHLFETPPSTISATASFFDLGGTSLDILRLKSLVSQHFPGVDLPVLAILTSPSIRQLAARIEAARHSESTPYDPIVELQSSGEKTPLFCIHPGVGEVLVFVNLAKYFVHERPFYALRARGFNPGEKPFESFAEMARTYADAIRSRQPHGPYAIAGYSFGAAVAFEVAKLLEADGERVDFLGSFNLPPHIKYRMDELDFVETAVNLAMFLDLITPQQAKTLPAQLRPLSKQQQLSHLIDIAPAGRLTELDLDLPRLTAWADLADSLTGLGRTYQPTGSVAAMSVFYAIPLRGSKQDWLENELRRWQDFTRRPPRYLDVPGEHYTLMGPKHVAAFQSILRTELDRALSGN